MERTPVILGLTRQAKLLGLPMPYTLAVGAGVMLPFIWTQWLPWILSAPILYGAARIATIANPQGHVVLTVVMSKTPPRFTLNKKKRLRRYV